MKMFKRIMLAALSLCMALGIVGLVAACGKSNAKKIDYTVTVTCTETEALANVKAGLTTAEGEAVEGGEAKALTDGAATFTVLPGTYQVVLTGVPETYEYQPATLTETTTTATITLTQKTPVGPQGPTIDAKYNGTWSNADHTLVVDTEKGTITLDGTQATDIAEDETAGYTFQCGGKTWSLYFPIEDPETLCLDDGEDDFSELTAGTYVPPTPATMPSDFPAKWYDEDETEAIVFDGATFTYMDEEGVVTAVTDNKDGTYTITATYMEDEISFTWTKADFTLSLTVYDTLVTYYAEGHVPFHINGVFDGTWTSSDGETTIVIDAEGATITIGEDAATGIALAADGSYTFTWNGESCSIYFVDDDYTTLYFEYGNELIELYPEGHVPLHIAPVYDGTWVSQDGSTTIVIDADANTITINNTAATDITEGAIAGYDFTWDGKSCSVYFVQEDYTTLLFDCGDDELIELYPEGHVPEKKEPVDSMPAGFPTEWESDGEELTFTGSTFTYMDEEGFVYEIDGNTFHALYQDMECVLTWDPEAHTLTLGMEGVDMNVTFNEKGYTPAGPVEMPEGFPTEWTSDTGTPLTFTGASFDDDGTTGTVTKVEHNQDGTYTFTATYGRNNTEITLVWDPEAETLTMKAAYGDTVYTPATPVENADIDASFDGTWVGDTEDGDMHFVVVIDAENDTITLNGKPATKIVANEENGGYDFNCDDNDWTIFLYVGKLTISDSIGYVTADLTKQVEEVFDPAVFLALELNGTWFADAYIGAYTQVPIKLTFTKDSLEVKFALNGTDSTGTVTAYDDATKTITAVIGGDTYYFVYDPETDRMTDGNPEGADSTKNYGPYIHYTYDFNSTAIQAPAWFGYTFAAAETTLSIKENYLVVNGTSQNRIRHYDAEKKELIVLFEGAHVFVTYDDGTNTLIATPLKEDAYGTISGTFYKVPDPLNPNLTWLDENTWESESGGSISFEGANVTVNATGINNWKGFITAHEAEKKTLTVYFIGHGSVTITYTEDTVRTLTCTLGGKSFTFTQTVILTLPEAINGKWVGKDDWKSVTIENGKMTVESGRYDKGPYDITNVANEGNIWTFNVNVASSEQNFTYDEEKDTLTVAIYNGTITFERYVEPAADPAELWEALSDTEWKPVSGAEPTYYTQNIVISADHTVTITTATTITLKVEDDKHLTYDNETTTWTITISSTVNNFFIYYNTATKVLTCGHAIYSGTPKVTTFEKVEKATLTLPEAVYNATWTSENTSYGYSIVFTSATKVKIQPSSYSAEVEVDVTVTDYADGTWSFTATWTSGSLGYIYLFTYQDNADVINVVINRSSGSKAGDMTLTKQGGSDVVDTSKLPEALYTATWTSDNTSYGYSFVFKDGGTQVTIQPSSSYNAYDGEVTDLKYDAETKTWTFQVLWKQNMLVYKYVFSYVDGADTITVGMYRSETATGNPAYTITLTKKN